MLQSLILSSSSSIYILIVGQLPFTLLNILGSVQAIDHQKKESKLGINTVNQYPMIGPKKETFCFQSQPAELQLTKFIPEWCVTL